MTDTRQEAYNTFVDLNQLSYKLISYLLENDEEIWKLLKYSAPDAWNMTNLTKAQKGALIWDGVKTATDCRVFFDIIDPSWTEQATIIRIFPVEIIPYNYVNGNSAIAFQVFTHNEISTLSDYTTRNMTVIQRFLEVFNGADIKGIGRLFFDAKRSSRCRLSTIGQLPMTGYSLVMCTNSTG